MLSNGNKNPTESLILPYEKTRGFEAIDLYAATRRSAQDWQIKLIYDILAQNNEGLWIHTKFGYSVPRRNGKSEIAIIRCLFGLVDGERILYTAHRTTTSHSVWERLKEMLDKLGFINASVARKADDVPNDLLYDSYKAYGLESIELRRSGGKINFRTRSAKGGLGEGYDLLVIDEAQEYTDDQASALKYVVTDSKNPQTIFCGTPPTAVSAGTVFSKLRESALRGETENTGWAEWSVPRMTDPQDREAWRKTNPSLGTLFTERAVADEIGSDALDFNIQRLGLWIRYNLKSAISEADWNALKCNKLPVFVGKLHVGIKFAHDGGTVSMAVAVRTKDDRIFVEAIGCKPVSAGYQWLLKFIQMPNVQNVVIDGANGQAAMQELMKDMKLHAPVIPTVKDVINAGSGFEQAMFRKTVCHMGQPSLTQSATNCEKRAIGSNGGFGYKSIMDDVDISLLESVILAHWSCSTAKERKPSRISY